MQSSYGVNTDYSFLSAPSSLPDCMRAKCSFFYFFDLLTLCYDLDSNPHSFYYASQRPDRKRHDRIVCHIFHERRKILTKKSCQMRFTMPRDGKITVFMNAVQNKGMYASH